MTLQELMKKIKDNNISESRYSIGSELKSDAFILYKNYSMWEFFYLDEKGNRLDTHIFFKDEDAFDYLWKALEFGLKFPPTTPPESIFR